MLIQLLQLLPQLLLLPRSRVGSSNSPLPLGTEQPPHPTVSVSSLHPGTPTPGLLCKAAQAVQAELRKEPFTGSEGTPWLVKISGPA